MGDECRHSTMEVIDGTIHLHDCDRPAGHAVPAVHKDSLSGVTWLELTRPAQLRARDGSLVHGGRHLGHRQAPGGCRWMTPVATRRTAVNDSRIDGMRYPGTRRDGRHGRPLLPFR